MGTTLLSVMNTKCRSTLRCIIAIIIETYFKTFNKIIVVKQYEFVELIIPKKHKVEPKSVYSFKRRSTTR
jgi:hypothetical protein